MNLKNLSDEGLLAQTKNLAAEERRITTEVLLHLREVERRRLYASRGFSSLFAYCVQELKYSESSAQRRIASMRLLREMPQIEEQIQTGELTLSVISQAQTFFKNENLTPEKKTEVLEKLENKSSREAEKILVGMAKKPVVPRERVKPVSPEQSELKFVVSEEMLRDLEKLKGLLAHQMPQPSLAELFQFAVKLALKKLDPAQKTEKPLPASEVHSATTRWVPTSIKTQIWKRDQGRCTYVDPKSGRKCGSNFRLEMDHAKPFSLGGETSPENLRLLCRTHNQLEARNWLGDWVGKYRKEQT